MTSEEEAIIRGIQKQSLISATIWCAAVFLAVAIMNNRVALSGFFSGGDLMNFWFGLASMVTMLAGAIMVLIASINVFFTIYLLDGEEA